MSRIRRRPAPLLAFDEVFHDSVRIGTDREAALIFDNSYARLIVERSGCSIVRKTMITSDFDTFHRYKRKAKPRFLSPQYRSYTNDPREIKVLKSYPRAIHVLVTLRQLDVS